MQQIEVVEKYPKESYELGAAFHAVVVAYKAAVADGFQAGADIPAILIASMADLMKGLEGVQNLPEEFKEDMGGVLKGALNPLLDAIGLLLKKE